MDMKYIILKIKSNQFYKDILKPANISLWIKIYEEDFIMLKMLSKLAEKYAKYTNTASYIFVILHQPKMPASLIKKD